MSTTPTVPVGTGAPVVLTVTIDTDGTLDMTTVTAASLDVRRPDGTIATWAASIAGGATTAALTLVHGFDGVTDIDVVGLFSLVPQLTVPTGTIPCTSSRLLVIDIGD